MKFSASIFLALFMAVSAQNTRESHLNIMKGNHDRRMERLEEMIEERRQRVNDHKSGRRRLSDDEYDLASRQIQNFQRKLESMKSRTDSDHMDRLEDLKSSRNIKLASYRDIEARKRHDL